MCARVSALEHCTRGQRANTETGHLCQRCGLQEAPSSSHSETGDTQGPLLSQEVPLPQSVVYLLDMEASVMSIQREQRLKKRKKKKRKRSNEKSACTKVILWRTLWSAGQSWGARGQGISPTWGLVVEPSHLHRVRRVGQ